MSLSNDINFSFCSERLIKTHNPEGISLVECWKAFKEYLKDNDIQYNARKHVKNVFEGYLKTMYVRDQDKDFKERYKQDSKVFFCFKFLEHQASIKC